MGVLRRGDGLDVGRNRALALVPGWRVVRSQHGRSFVRPYRHAHHSAYLIETTPRRGFQGNLIAEPREHGLDTLRIPDRAGHGAGRRGSSDGALVHTRRVCLAREPVQRACTTAARGAHSSNRSWCAKPPLATAGPSGSRCILMYPDVSLMYPACIPGSGWDTTEYITIQFTSDIESPPRTTRVASVASDAIPRRSVSLPGGRSTVEVRDGRRVVIKARASMNQLPS